MSCKKLLLLLDLKLCFVILALFITLPGVYAANMQGLYDESVRFDRFYLSSSLWQEHKSSVSCSVVRIKFKQ